MAESSDDPLAMPLSEQRPTPIRKAIPQQRRSNPLYVPHEESYESAKEESSDPTLLKSPVRRAIWRGITPRTPRPNASTEAKGKMWIAVNDAVAVEENGDATVRPNTERTEEEERNGYSNVFEADMTLDDDDIWRPDAVEEGHAGEGVGVATLMQEGILEDGDQEMHEDLVLSEGEFQPRTSDDEIAIHLKLPEELEEIQEEIQDLLEKIPDLQNDYQLVDRLGTGTFSSVFKAIDLNYDSYDNRLWEGPKPNGDLPLSPDVQTHKPTYVAIKRIIVTSSPRRILNELLIMESCRGCRNVAQLITAYRVEDQIVAVMPYQRSTELKDLIKTLGVYDLRQYFRCMFRALRDIHARGIIHRDLKPANFLYDPIESTGTMVDFGLAEEFAWDEERETGCRHTAPTHDAPHGAMKEGVKWNNLLRKSIKVSREKSELPAESVGWPTDDTRPVLKANRAGTRGFRAPEVLFKCMFQSPAIDIWSAGTILLFFLTGKSPLFTASSDMHALLEQALILGKAAMEECAALHCRTFSTNIPEVQDRTPWIQFVKRLNPTLFASEVPTSPPRTVEEMDEAKRARLLLEACDLLDRCLEPLSVKRITARDALYHSFLAPDLEELTAAQEQPGDEPVELDEDELFPHPPGEGICDMYHRQEKSGDWSVFVGFDEKGDEDWEAIEAGQGQAIGSKPCEFHEVIVYPLFVAPARHFLSDATMQRISDFSVLPIAYSSQVTHCLYIRPHLTKSKGGASDEFPPNRTLFVVNIPPDASERELITLFSKQGVVERVAFAGHDRVEEIIDQEVETSEDEAMETQNDGALDTKKDEDERTVQQHKKRGKQEKEKAVIPKVIPLPTSTLRHLRPTGGIGHIIFTSPQALASVLALATSAVPLIWPKFKATSGAEPSGLSHYIARYKALRPPLGAVKEHADSSMEVYEYKQTLANRNTSKYRKGEAIVDDDGFTLVTRGGAYGQTLGGGVGVASKKFMQEVSTGGKRNRKKKSAQKDGFYAFQVREKRIQEQISMKKSFDADKLKVEKSKQERKFRPY